jgi:SAM-dependent methyltransferase
MHSEYYDKVFSETPHYQGSPEKSPYYPLWMVAINSMKGYLRVLDAGCGPGQFGELCVKADHKYVGLDYSSTAVELAKAKGYGTYYLVDLNLDTSMVRMGKYDIFTGIEALEHIEKDVELVASIPVGRGVIISGPNYPGVEHLRFFDSMGAFKERYGGFLRLEKGWTLSGRNVRGEDTEIYMIKGARVK